MPAKIDEDHLQQELRRLAGKMDEPPTQREMNEEGEYSAGVYYNRFGSWNAALKSAGLDPDDRSHTVYSDEQLIEDICDFADELGRRPKIEDMDESGPHTAKTYKDRFGSWSEALELAGFNPDVRIESNELIAHLQSLANELGHRPSHDDMEKQGCYGTAVYRERFGSWTDALETANVSDMDMPSISDRRSDSPSREELISKLNMITDKIGQVPSISDFREQGVYSISPFIREFGSWNQALKAAGLEPVREMNVPDDVLLSRLSAFAVNLGRSPTAMEMENNGPHSSTTYQTRFGKWNAALQEAGLEINRERNVSVTDKCANCGANVERRPHHRRDYDNCFCSPACMGEWQSEHYTGVNNPRWRGGYDAQYGEGWNEEKKADVRRDCDYQCQACELPQEDHIERFGCRLPVHHIRREEYFHSEREFNSKSNLITLCSRCHPQWEGIPLRPDTREVSG